jgi:hypothetical protein
MSFAWISRVSHLEMMGLLTAQIAELTAERKVLLDRLATLGLGGPLFHVVEPIAAVAEQSSADANEAAEELEQLLRLRRRPSQLAGALTRKVQRDAHKGPAGPRVSWVPAADAVNAALDQAEAAGKMA